MVNTDESNAVILMIDSLKIFAFACVLLSEEWKGGGNYVLQCPYNAT